MNSQLSSFDEHEVLHELKHYLPAQTPLKDFIHHNTLHAFQSMKFKDGIRYAAEILGYRSSLSLSDYRKLYDKGSINTTVLDHMIKQKKGTQAEEWTKKLLTKQYENTSLPRIGSLRANWKRHYRVDLDSLVHPILFRIICSYLDQGIAIWNFPIRDKGFLASLKEIEEHSFTSFFRRKRAQNMLLNTPCNITDLLKILVGDEKLYKHYLFDQQFSHQGWSGMVSAIEDQPSTVLDPRKISLHDFIVFELLLEIDALDYEFGKQWVPLARKIINQPIELFSPVEETELHEVLYIWQQALEWTYYDPVLAGLQKPSLNETVFSTPSFQSIFCIDDRECSIRRHLESVDHSCETFGTPGFFSAEFYYQPEGGKFYTKLCPAPVTPKYLVKGVGGEKHKRDLYFNQHSHSFYGGWLISQTLGFWSAFKLSLNIFKPTMGPATASSFNHMSKNSELTIENKDPKDRENDLQIGFNEEEMSIRTENLLRSIGLVRNFASLIYLVGHGSSSVNNPHYAAYDCGACSGRAGSVNARVMAYMANHVGVRKRLKLKGIFIPNETRFISALHDTTRDEIVFFDEQLLSPSHVEAHTKHEKAFTDALHLNAKERSRRFMSIDTRMSAQQIHEKIKIRSVSLFEPRPELNHATNSLCIVGRRELSKHVFLDRRAFLNSFDYRVDPEGNFLLGILRAVAPVCGGINLEYYFSRVDNQKLGAGSKLPHNVMGLVGVANGIDGDLRPGLPSQMIEVHDPVRLLVVVEHFPEVVLNSLLKEKSTYNWFANEWIFLIAIHPETHQLYLFQDGNFSPYNPVLQKVEKSNDLMALIESSQENLPVYYLS